MNYQNIVLNNADYIENVILTIFFFRLALDGLKIKTNR